MRIVLSLILILLPFRASAHLGHLGELTGHSHWIALGAVVVAAAIAAKLAHEKKSKNQDDNSPEGVEAEEIEAEEGVA